MKTPRRIAKEIEAKHREYDQEQDPQRRAVLLGETADLMRELRRAALQRLERNEARKRSRAQTGSLPPAGDA